MRAVLMILIIVGTAAMLLILILYTYLFIIKNKKRTAIERSLEIGRGKCALSIMSGMTTLSALGITAGVGAGYLLGNTIMKIANIIGNSGAYDLNYSSWVNNADQIAQVQMDLQQTSLNVFVMAVFLFL